MTPLVSIAMPSFNQAQYIEAAIESVFNQPYSNLELVVSDGGSTDETPEILSRIGAKEPRLRWVSEPDDGPADAIWKSFSKARGEIVGWLNSDEMQVLSDALGFQQHLQQIERIALEGSINPEALGAELRNVLVRAVNADGFEDLSQRLIDHQTRSADICETRHKVEIGPDL